MLETYKKIASPEISFKAQDFLMNSQHLVRQNSYLQKNVKEIKIKGFFTKNKIIKIPTHMERKIAINYNWAQKSTG